MDPLKEIIQEIEREREEEMANKAKEVEEELVDKEHQHINGSNIKKFNVNDRVVYFTEKGKRFAGTIIKAEINPTKDRFYEYHIELDEMRRIIVARCVHQLEKRIAVTCNLDRIKRASHVRPNGILKVFISVKEEVRRKWITT